MSRALIFGANLGTLGLIRELQMDGYHCTALGHDPEQIGAVQANTFHQIDYHDIDSLPHSVRSGSFDIVIPGAHDMCLKAYASFMDSQENTQGFDADDSRTNEFERIHNKHLFREGLRQLSPARCPGFVEWTNGDVSALREDLFPALFKPNHAGGGRGIVHLQTSDEFRNLNSTSKLASGVIEQIVQGVDLSLSLWMLRGQVVQWYADREFSEIRPFHISGSLSNNALIDLIHQAGIVGEMGVLLNSMGHGEGFTHCQIRLQSPTHWHLIEITRRLPGDLYPLVPEWFAGIPYTRAYIDSFRGQIRPASNRTSFHQDHAVGRVCVPAGRNIRAHLVPLARFSSHAGTVPDSYQLCLLALREAWDLLSPQLSLLED
jgi:hypothetical protein